LDVNIKIVNNEGFGFKGGEQERDTLKREKRSRVMSILAMDHKI
jgi:hypothetical protein